MSEKYPVTALVPMKGHSERVPSKNIRLLAGKPLCFYILTALQAADNISQIIVNTDDSKIMSLVRGNFPDIVVLDRPKHLLGTKVPMPPIIEYDLKHADAEHFLQTHATVPLLKPQTIDNAVKTYFEGLDNGFDSVMGVTSYQTRFYDHNKSPLNHNPDIMVPSQDMPCLYEDNSTFYINSKNNFYRRRDRVGEKPIFVEVPKLESIDIDQEQDFILAEAVLNFFKDRKTFV